MMFVSSLKRIQMRIAMFCACDVDMQRKRGAQRRFESDEFHTMLVDLLTA